MVNLIIGFFCLESSGGIGSGIVQYGGNNGTPRASGQDFELTPGNNDHSLLFACGSHQNSKAGLALKKGGTTTNFNAPAKSSFNAGIQGNSTSINASLQDDPNSTQAVKGRHGQANVRSTEVSFRNRTTLRFYSLLSMPSQIVLITRLFPLAYTSSRKFIQDATSFSEQS